MRKSALGLGITITLMTSSAAFAQYQGYGSQNGYGPTYDERSQQDQYGRTNGGANRDGRYENRENADRQFQDRSGFNDRDAYIDRDDRGGYRWRPGQVLPQQFLTRVVSDWEERGLSRPPRGHQWVRVGQQFVLVRGQDGMIARILNFD